LISNQLSLQFVAGVEERELRLGIVEDLVVAEEAAQLYGGGLGRVAGVDYVFLKRHGEVAADGAWQCLSAVGGACHLAYYLYGIDTFVAAYYDGRYHHGILELLEEGLALVLCVVLAHLFVGELAHLHACQTETFLFKAFCHFAHETALQA